jgi:hypothetical protein
VKYDLPGQSAEARHFGGGAPKAPAPPPPPPKIDDQAVQDAAAKARQLAGRRRGRRASILTGTGDAGAETLGAGDQTLG